MTYNAWQLLGDLSLVHPPPLAHHAEAHRLREAFLAIHEMLHLNILVATNAVDPIMHACGCTKVLDLLMRTEHKQNVS